jgi:hypothetical protein
MRWQAGTVILIAATLRLAAQNSDAVIHAAFPTLPRKKRLGAIQIASGCHRDYPAASAPSGNIAMP